MTITPADGGFTPLVNVVGAGFDAGLSASADLGLPVGSYVVRAAPVTTPDPIVGLSYLPTVTGSPATVTAGNTTQASVDYALRPESGMAWIPNYGDGNLYGFTSAMLQAGIPDGGDLFSYAREELNTDAGDYAETVALDAHGDLWLSEYDGQLWHWTFLPDGGPSTPTVLTPMFADGGTLSYPGPMAFAPNGDLWVVDYNLDLVAAVPASELAAGGNPVFSEVISSQAVGDAGLVTLSGPWGIGFDAQGNAWLANWTGATVEEHAPLADGGLDPNPRLVYESTGLDFSSLAGVAFDPNGDPWVANNGKCTVVHFAGQGYQGIVDVDSDAGAGAVIATLTTANGLCGAPFASPINLAFDQSGALWAGSSGSPYAYQRFTNPDQYQGSAAPTPVATYPIPGYQDSSAIVFDPAPPGSNLYPVSTPSP